MLPYEFEGEQYKVVKKICAFGHSIGVFYEVDFWNLGGRSILNAVWLRCIAFFTNFTW